MEETKSSHPSPSLGYSRPGSLNNFHLDVPLIASVIASVALY